MKLSGWTIMAVIGVASNAVFALVAMRFDPDYPAILVIGHMASMILSAAVFTCEERRMKRTPD